MDIWSTESNVTTEQLCDIIQMMHSSEWTLKYDEPEADNVAFGLRSRATCSTGGHHISMSHERPCFICFVVWPTISLKLYYRLLRRWRNTSEYRVTSKNAHRPIAIYTAKLH